MLKENLAPLRYYHESWWKVVGEDLWYLAGKHEDLKAGQWYFTDETSDYNGPYDSRAEAAAALRKYREHL